MSKTERIERIRNDIDHQLSFYYHRIDILNKRKNKLMGISMNIIEPHALIPKWYDDIEEWIKGIHFQKHVLIWCIQTKKLLSRTL